MYIVFEGLDGSGKTTQLELLKQYFLDQGNEVVVTCEPGATEIGKELRMLIKGHRISKLTREMLFQADRAETISTIVKPALDDGKIVISDRSFLTGLAYTDLDIDTMVRLSYFSTSGIRPDLVIIPEVKEETFISRVLNRDGKLDVIETEVAKNAIAIQNKIYNFSLMYIKNVIKVNGDQSVEQVFSDIVSQLDLK